MYVPPYEYLLRQIGQERGRIDEADSVQIPLKFFKLLIQNAIAAEHFDEDLYLRTYLDVNTAIEDKGFDSAAQHYLAVGYFEGRRNPTATFDEQWYINNYSNIFEEITENSLAGALDHYLTIGMQDGYAPNQKCFEEMKLWKQVLR